MNNLEADWAGEGVGVFAEVEKVFRETPSSSSNHVTIHNFFMHLSFKND
jgi:hypothetical protein